MLGNFTYCNPTKIHFGPDVLDSLGGELAKYGKNVLLVYGGGSIKKNGIYDSIIKILENSGKNAETDDHLALESGKKLGLAGMSGGKKKLSKIKG